MKKASLYYSTYARTILSELKALSVLIRKYSNATQESVTQISGLPNILSLEQIEQALLNPQNSIKPSMTAYATLIKSRRNIGNLQETSRNQRNLLQESIVKLRAKLTETTKEQEKAEISDAIQEMEKSYAQLLAAYKKLMEFGTKIIQLEHYVVQLIKNYDEEWENYRRFYLQDLLTQIEKLNVPLSETEKKDLLAPETWVEVLSRFSVADTPIPDYLHVENPKYTTYFKLKAYLALHASLSRQMLPSTPENILKFLKKLPL